MGKAMPVAPLPLGHDYGLHRVIEPAGLLPQPAWRIDNQMTLHDNELLIDVQALNVDAASFTQIREEVGDDRLTERVLEIVAQRGKLHNPVTGSGGMLLGTVAAIGPRFPNPEGLKPGDRIATLVSLSLTPLRLQRVRGVNLATHQLAVEGQAILFATGLYARLPDDLDERLALAVLDVAGAPAQTDMLVRPGDRVVVIGGGGKAGTLCLHAARQRAGDHGQVIGVSPVARECAEMRTLGWIDQVLQVDATDAVAMMQAVEQATDGALADVVINCVNVPHTEMASILAARQGGTVCFFSMATSFTAAALGAEGVGKDVTLLIGNGYARGHAELTLRMLRDDPVLRDLLARRYVPAEVVA
jgi:L-erythro-3,5-diaminohexanoate dehydrogenase